MAKPANMRIEDVGAATARADLNDILISLASLQTTDGNGTPYTGEPATTYPSMLWNDKATNTLKIRSDANDAWIEIGSLDQSTNKFTPRGATPSGTIITFAGSTAPDGYLKANGAAVSRTTYADLFTAIGTTYGSGDGSTTFNLPDLRGEFVRGWDDGRGVDSGRSFGSAQLDAFKSHAHLMGRNFVSFTSNGVVATGVGSDIATSDNGGDETRPRNIALLYCIKT